MRRIIWFVVWVPSSIVLGIIFLIQWLVSGGKPACDDFMEALLSEPGETLYRVVERYLVNGADAGKEHYGIYPLQHSFYRGRMDVFDLLITHGADISVMGWDALHHAIIFGTLGEVEDLARTADMSALDASGNTPFLLACEVGDVARAKFLLPLSGEKDTYANGTPALGIAASRNHWNCSSGWFQLDLIRMSHIGNIIEQRC